MEHGINYAKIKVDVADYALAVKEFTNTIDILNAYYQFYASEYKEYWRLSCIIRLIMDERDKLIELTEELKKNFYV